jgi:cysteine desulfurase/selenocysteine lyase
LPHKFEAGTPNIAGGIVLGTAVDYINSIGIENIQEQEKELLEYGTKKLLEIEGLKIFGTQQQKLP